MPFHAFILLMENAHGTFGHVNHVLDIPYLLKKGKKSSCSLNKSEGHTFNQSCIEKIRLSNTTLAASESAGK